MSTPETTEPSGTENIARAKRLNKLLQTPTDGEYDSEKYEIIAKLTEFDQGVGIKLINACFFSWYNDDDAQHECQMGEDEFLEDFLKSVAHTPVAGGVTDVKKIVDACSADDGRNHTNDCDATPGLECR